MKVADIFSNAKATGAQPISFEMFPPKGELTLEHAREVAEQFQDLHPDFVSVTYSAGGSGNSGATAKIASMLTHDELQRKIDEMRQAGVENVLALRGDLPQGTNAADAARAEYPYAKDLIPALVDAGFCVGAAAYPEGHITCENLELSVEHLKQKQDAGASFFVTQLFFDNECFFRFREMADRAGITVPITAGIMPFMSKQQISRMVFMCGASLPSPVIKLLAKYEDNPDALREAGIEYACRQLEGLRDAGADGLHIYTMNRPSVARATIEALRK